MPTRYWLVDDTQIQLRDRGPALGITLVVDDRAQPIPPRTLGSWPIVIAGRTVSLEARRNLDVVRFQVYSDGHLVPRKARPSHRIVPAAGSSCSAHDTAAATTCPRCTRAFCAACAPDGNHCEACLRGLVADERAAIKRLRSIGSTLGFALAVAVVVIGAAITSLRTMEVGFAAVGAVVTLVVWMTLRERAESRAGLPPASDT